MKKYIVFILVAFASCSGNERQNSNQLIEGGSNSSATNSNLRFSHVFENELSIDLPDNWEIRDSLASQSNVLHGVVFAENCGDSLQRCSNMILRVIKNDQKQNLDEVVEYFVTSLSEQFDTLKIVSVKDYNLNEFGIKIIDYKMKTQGMELGSTCSFFLFNEKIVTMFFTGTNSPNGSYLNERKKAIDIINSLKKQVKG